MAFAGFKTGGKCSSCCDTCTIFTDDFSTDRTGTDYTIVSGTPTVSGGVLTTTSAGFLIVENTAGSDNSGRAMIVGKVDTSGGSFRIVGSYVDSSNYVFAELTINGASSTFKLWERVAGTNTQLGTTFTFTGATATNYTLCINWDGEYVIATLDEDTKVFRTEYTGDGNQAGFGASPNGGTATFDDFDFSRLSPAEDCPACAEQPCTLFSDDFSVDNLATDWDDVSGTWTVSSGGLSTSSASAVLRCETAIPTGTTVVSVKATITPSAINRAGKVLMGISGDAYWYAEVSAGTNHGWLKLYQRTGGVNNLKGSTKVVGFQEDEPLTVTLCLSGGVIRASVNTLTETCIVYPAAISTGLKCGLGTGTGTTAIAFDDFSIEITSPDLEDCVECDTTGCCTIFNDDFTTNDIAQFYTAVGTFSVAAGAATSTDGTCALTTEALGTTGHGKTTLNARVSTTLSWLRAGALCVDATLLYAELRIDGASSTFKLWQNNGFTQIGSTVTLTAAHNTTYRIEVCWDGANAFAALYSGSTQLASANGACTRTANKARVGAVNASSGTSTFYDIKHEKNKSDDANCSDCNSVVQYCTPEDPHNNCVDGLHPQTITATIAFDLGDILGGAENLPSSQGGADNFCCEDIDLLQGTHILELVTPVFFFGGGEFCGDAPAINQCFGEWRVQYHPSGCYALTNLLFRIQVRVIRFSASSDFRIVAHFSLDETVSYPGSYLNWWMFEATVTPDEPINCLEDLIDDLTLECTYFDEPGGGNGCDITNVTLSISN